MVDEDISTSWSESDLYGTGELFGSLEELFSGLAAEKEFFGGVVSLEVCEFSRVLSES